MTFDDNMTVGELKELFQRGNDMTNIKIEDEFELAKIIDKVKADCSPNRSFAYAYTEHLKMNDKPVNIYSDGEKIFIIPTDYKPIKVKLYMPIQK